MKIKLLNEYAKLPTRASEYAAGYDLYAAMAEPVVIQPGKVEKIHTGVAFGMTQSSSNAYFGAIYARSGMATKRGLRPANAVGVIDPDYTGECLVPLYNDSEEPQTVEPGERVAQIVFMPYKVVREFEVVDELDATERADGGFGHSGTH